MKADSSTNSVRPTDDPVVLTVNGYIINRERIEISPRFLGMVKWIGVKKGDAVTNGQVVVTLDDTEYRARLMEAEGQLHAAKAAVERDELTYERIKNLIRTSIETQQSVRTISASLPASISAVTLIFAPAFCKEAKSGACGTNSGGQITVTE